MERPNLFIQKRFGISMDEFFDILSISQGAEGYILGSLGEQLFKKYAEERGYEVYRIKEKPKGGNNAKADDARGDFYIRKRGVRANEWYVVECKSAKSNAEDRAIVARDIDDVEKRKRKCVNYLCKFSVNRSANILKNFRSGFNDYTKAKLAWTAKNPDVLFPNFRWNQANPGAGFPDLSGLWNSKKEIEDWINSFPDEAFSSEAFYNLEAPIRLIQTHMPSTRVDELGIKSTGPLVTEFNILCMDLFIRTGRHELVFVNSQDLNHQAGAPNHLQQNYNIDILVQKDGFRRHPLLRPWYDDLDACIRDTRPTPREIDLSQLDYR